MSERRLVATLAEPGSRPRSDPRGAAALLLVQH